MPALMTALTLRLTHPCARCSRPLPLRTLSRHTRCVTCGHSTALSQETWAQRLPRAEVAALLLGEEAPEDAPISRRMPRCRSCARPIDLQALPRAVPGGGLRCRCGEWVAVRSADALTRSLAPGALYVVGETPAAVANEPVLFACMGCGSAMHADGRKRVVDCACCTASNYLPDALWSALHPVEEEVEITVIGRLLESERLTLSLESPAACRALAARAELAPDLWPILAAHDDASVRASLAANPGAPLALRATLAEDPQPAVRAALAGCARVHPRLLIDAESSVRAALAAHPETPPETLARLAEDPAPEVRQVVARAASTPTSALCAMIALESEEAVLLTLLARDELPAEVLTAMATPQQSARIARRLVSTPALPDAAACQLAGHFEDTVRLALLARDDLPASALRTLASDATSEIRQDARAHPEFVISRRRRRRLTLAISSAVVLFGGAGGLLAATLIAVRFSDELFRLVP